MAEIFSVTLPDGSQYDLKDQVARDFINEVAFKEDTTYGPSDIVSFNSDISKPVKNLKINIEPI